MIVSNTRAPSDAEGDLHAQAEATRVAEREILRLVEKYGSDTVVTAFQEVQDYVERLTRQRVAELPDGTWETEDYIDYDPSVGEGLIPDQGQDDDRGRPDPLRPHGSHPAVGTFLNSASARRSPASSPARRRSSPTFPSTRASTARQRRPRAGGHGRQRRRGRSPSPASAPGPTRRS